MMFETLTNRLTDAFAKLTRKGVLREDDVVEAMREVRVALLEADVALPVVKDLIAEIQKEAVGADRRALGDAGPDGGEDRPRSISPR